MRMNDLLSLPHQGEVHRLVDVDAATLWSETVQKLPPQGIRFAQNMQFWGVRQV